MKKWFAVALLVAACGQSEQGGGGSGGSAGRGGTGGSAGTGGSGGTGGQGGSGGTGGTVVPGPEVTGSDPLGGWLPGAVRSVLHGQSSSLTLVGTNGVGLDRPELLGLGRLAGQNGQAAVGGILVIDTSSGRVRVVTEGLPTIDYGDPGMGPAPILSLAWVHPDETFAAAAYTSVVVGHLGETVTLTSAELRREGADSPATVTAVAVAGGAIYAATDLGLAAIDPSTLAPSWIALDLEQPWVYGLATVPFASGEAVAALYGPSGTLGATRLALVQGDSVHTFALPDGATGLSLAGTPARLLVGLMLPGPRGAVLSLPDGAGALEELISADELARASDDPFVPVTLAWDAERKQLLLGGAITTFDPRRSGGIAVFDTDDAAVPTGDPRALVERPDRYLSALPWSVDVLSLDPAGSVWVAGRRLCNAEKAGVTGLYRIERHGKDLRLVLPVVSGVRAIAVHPDTRDIWLGIRNENPGLSCEGISVQQGLCVLKADGSCELVTLGSTDLDNRFADFPGVSSIEFGGEQQLAVATLRDTTYFRNGAAARALPTQFDPGISLQETAVRLGRPGDLWVAAAGDWSGADDEAAHDRSPRGMALIAYDQGESHRYVRALGDEPAAGDVGGLPSDWVWDVLPLAGRAHALVATGVERIGVGWDHLDGPVAPGDHGGGLAEVNGVEVQTIDAAWAEEVVALTFTGDSSILALDAHLGVLAVDVSMHTVSMNWLAPWSMPERGTALATDSEGRTAVGTTEGLWVLGASGGATHVLEGGVAGRVWAVRFSSPGVLEAGTDQGLLRFALDGAALPSRGPEGMLPRQPWDLDAGCYGQEGCRCYGGDDCNPGTVCGCVALSDCICQRPVSFCDANPGGLGCACTIGESTCSRDLGCGCEADGTGCTCRDATCNLTGCACQVDADCESASCGDVSHVCEPDGSCSAHCTCATETGCPDGMICDPHGVAGPYCRAG